MGDFLLLSLFYFLFRPSTRARVYIIRKGT